MSIHVVSQGETIADIAAEYGVSPNRLSFDNQLSEQDHLVAGQALLVLQPDVIHETARGETIPSIAARYLSLIHIFSGPYPPFSGQR